MHHLERGALLQRVCWPDETYLLIEPAFVPGDYRFYWKVLANEKVRLVLEDGLYDVTEWKRIA